MRTSVSLALAFVLVVPASPALAQSVVAVLDYGPHPVGFRAVTDIDRSRTVQSKRAFDGTPNAGDSDMAIQIGVWYPAANVTSGSPMSAERYKTLWTRIDRSALVADFGRLLTFGELTANDAQIVETLTRQTRARSDAEPSKTPFPLIVAGASTSMTWPAFEYLASLGYVVVSSWSSIRTATLQATHPAIALETETRNLEYLTAFSRREQWGDPSRLGIIGVNFDGMAALNFEMRNMRADAVISLDGYEGKRSGTAMLQASPHFEPLRMRVPYLIVVQDERDPGPPLMHDRAVFDALAYSTRRRCSPALAWRPRQRLEEFERLVMDGPIERAARAYRAAKAANPHVQIFDENTINLYAFRYTQRKQLDAVLALRRLAVDAFPESADAAYQLGIAAADCGNRSESGRSFARALTLLEGSAMAPQDKEAMRKDFRTRAGGTP